ncbi:hypothetical protein EDD66_103140 [Mobilisporobacter senegalensis]|uniref:Uncharacterized protein n=1 Tax=Mobilisporobacter senegalensis TaxID=1329262 RepID=A0A3N1XRE6_9FIRM|nr:hypothetical protein EDD66_103140 [Mobilisporobacter senegalensis]
MTLEDAIEIIEKENLNRYKKVSFNGEDISEN